ncbi:hypothetical protein STCU_00949 [Strigomonas culicis]|uniref:Uncharacterized protein n=1 Tax=Strigomonas culicis TaxID=28005 RepID=S9WIL0_9TRYP|nr:hypothetical protein STCU_00949 [Strigomonas culicis]|eukprot:EPY35725.1 hypothetical protein STCU_00949 [Strigomonas culicis]
MTESFQKATAVEKNRDGMYSLQDRAFERLPKESPVVARRREVRKFKSAPGEGQLPRWNASTVDEAHPFPQHAQSHTTTTYQGVDVITSHFPDRVKNTAHLRNDRPPQWSENTAKASTLNRYTYKCDALKDKQPPLSFLAKTIVEDNAPDKRQKRNGWQGSTSLEGHAANRFVAEKRDLDYKELNKTKLGVMNESNYVAPEKRVKELNLETRRQKQMQRDAKEETEMTLFQTVGGLKTFTMKNKKEWIDVDPVAVAAAQVEKKHELSINPYTQYGKSTMKQESQ